MSRVVRLASPEPDVPHQERAELTRSIILDSAAQVFDQRGFLGASITDIIAEAGVTRGALYFHFTSKEALARAIIDEQFAAWILRKKATRPGVQTLIDLAHLLAKRLQEDVRVRASIRLLIERGTFVEPDPTPYTEAADFVRDCLAQAQRDGDITDKANVTDLARTIVGCWTGVQLSSAVLTDRTDLSQRTTEMWSLLLPGLVPPCRLHRLMPGGSPNFDGPC